MPVKRKCDASLDVYLEDYIEPNVLLISTSAASVSVIASQKHWITVNAVLCTR